MISRRGFLHTLAAAVVGAATFDPKSLLWVPAPAPLASVTEIATPAVGVDAQLELNALALRFARHMTERLDRHRAVALREVIYRYADADTLTLPPGFLDIDEVGRGYFVPADGRLMITHQVPTATKAIEDLLHEMTGQMHSDVEARHVDMFAPMGVELRPAEPFSDDVAIGVATDPDSGLCVRVLRFDVDRRRGSRTLTGFEVAGGQWISRQEARRRLKTNRKQAWRQTWQSQYGDDD